jgi:hypothetical protein
VGQDVEAGDLVAGVGDRPDDERRAEQDEDVAVVVRAGDELLGQRVDAAGRQGWAVTVDAPRFPRGGDEARDLVEVSSTASPQSAWLATAWAGQ